MFKDRLISLRKSKKLTQAEMANIIGVHRATYSNYETGLRNPDYETLKKIADFFDVTTDYLLGRVDDPDTYATKEKFLEEADKKGLDYSGLTDEEIEMFQKWIEDYLERKKDKQ